MRWIAGLIASVFVMAVVSVGIGYFWLRGSLPQTEGNVQVAGIVAPVEIVRDSSGIPHIYGKSEADGWFGLGYAHAQDRLWQMDFNRRIGAGRLSEILGDKGLQTDKFLRTLSVYHYAEQNYANETPRTRAMLQAYAAGVNSYIANKKGAMPPEFYILGVTPRPWKPADSLVWSKMMAWDLGANWSKEILRLRMLKEGGLSQQQISELFPPYPGDAPVALPDLASLYDGIELPLKQLAQATREMIPDPGNGSNNWVVSGPRTSSGKPLLANDPHLGLAAPPVWYFAHINTPDVKVMGATLPGIPGVVLGRNQRIAWGFTNTGPDVQDMFIEKLVGDKYLTPDGPKAFETRKEVIHVKDGEDVELNVRISRHGPIISDVLASASKVVGEGHVMAFSWTALRPDNTTARAILDINRAGNWSEFKGAIRSFDVPQQNMVYADVDGNIGYYAPGRVPVRHPDNKIRGFMPVPGWEAKYDWQGFIPFEELPHIYNPARNFVATANHKVVDKGYPHFITGEWAPPYRARRIESLLTGRDKHTVSSFREIQSDVKSLYATDLLPRLLKVKPASDDAAKAVKMLSSWDATMDRTRPEPLIYNAWMRELGALIYADELGEMFKSFQDSRSVFTSNVLIGGQDHWCDNVRTTNTETCDELISEALVKALADTRTRTGSEDMATWRWGELHFAHSDHNPFTHVGSLAGIFDVSIPNNGDGFTVNVGRHKISDEEHPWRQFHGPSLRAIYDLSDLDKSRWIHSTGESGNVFSPYYANFAETWRNVEDMPMTMDRSAIEAGSIGTLTLKPKN
jgi:penicillin G amidase